MKRTMKCIRFEVSRIVPSMLIFLAIYFGCYLLFFLLFCVAPGSRQGSGNFNMSFAAMIYFFVLLCATYTNFTNNLAIFGNTRSQIYASLAATSIGFSVVLSILSLVSDAMSDVLLRLAHIRSVTISSILYGGINLFETFLFVFCMLLLVSGVSLFYGSLSYRFGRTFKLVFWVAFGVIAMVLANVGEAFHFLDAIADAFKWYVGYGMSFGCEQASLHFAVTGALFALVGYLLARRQPQIA